VPQFQQSDTLVLLHPVVLQQDLDLPTNSHIHISPGGGLCGHQKITMQPHSSMLVEGILELDSIFLFTAQVRTTYSSRVTLYRYAHITGTGALWSNFGVTRVGPWFDCKLPEFAFAVNTKPVLEQQPVCQVFPNPAYDKLTVETEVPVLLNLYNLAGRSVLSEDIEATWQIPISNLPKGLYSCVVTTKTGKMQRWLLQIN
jgi:hypothetical protein